MGGFCPLMELHQKGSAPAACAASLFSYFTIFYVIPKYRLWRRKQLISKSEPTVYSNDTSLSIADWIRVARFVPLDGVALLIKPGCWKLWHNTRHCNELHILVLYCTAFTVQATYAPIPRLNKPLYLTTQCMQGR